MWQLERYKTMSHLQLNAFPYRILVDITFHYNKSRLQYLFQVVRAFSEYPIESMDIIIVTNVAEEDKLHEITSLCVPLIMRHPARPGSSKTLSVESFPNLADPWQLTWCHKHLISGRFLDANIAYSHYIHVEDDILASFDNFCYFVRYRELLRSKRLIPSFHRVEFNSNDNRLYLVDQIGVSDFLSRQKVDVDEFAFVNPDYPYNAMFILDRDLALEYLNSRSFDRDRSVDVRPQWGLSERASMGLCFENPAEGFSCRYAIPVNHDTRKTPYWCWVYHIANNYTKNKRLRFGKTQPSQLFSNDITVVKWRPPTKLDNVVWHLNRLAKRVWYGPPPGTGHDLVPRDLCPLCGMKEQEWGECAKPSCPLPG
jgi:hypothetical protein